MKQKQHVIKSADILKVIKNFNKVVPRVGTLTYCLNMGASAVVDKEVNLCNTTHCHGGWYAIATLNYKKRLLDFADGSTAMAKHLGFKEVKDEDGDIVQSSDSLLCEWAEANPKLWGNEYGSDMFCDEIAFLHKTKRPNGAEHLQHIVDHWEEVYARVLARETKAAERREAYAMKKKKHILLTVPPVDALINTALIAEARYGTTTVTQFKKQLKTIVP